MKRLVFALFLTLTAQAQFPPGTIPFYSTGATDAVAAPGGGVWVGTETGLALYTAAGLATTLTTPGTGARNLIVAGDGSIWFVNESIIGRISSAGVMLEQYPMTEVRAIGLASDGALFYARATLGQTMGRIAAGTPAEFPSPAQVWAIESAGDGDVWVLGNGFGTPTDFLYRVDETGAATSIPLNANVLFGELRIGADGTVYVGTGLNHDLLRMNPGSSSFELVAPLPGVEFVPDDSGAVWTGEANVVLISPSGEVLVNATMPNDLRSCDHPYYLYQPVAIDATGAVWVRVVEESPGIIGFPIPCGEPGPVMPDLLRIDPAVFLAAYDPEHIPALSPFMLLALVAVLAAGGIFLTGTR